MPDKKMSLEDILDQYSPENETPKTSVGRVDAQKIVNSTLEVPDIAEKAEKRKAVSHERTALFDGALRRPSPADDFKPADLSRHRISVVDKDNIGEIKTVLPKKQEPDLAGVTPPIQMDPEAAPKIRRMKDSTRARELETLKTNKKKRKKNKNGYTYDRESPEGEYVYSPPSFKKKKTKTRSQMEAELRSTEGRKHITDIVPSPEAVEAARPVEPAPRAKQTSINLSEREAVDARALDVHITQGQDEYLSEKVKRKRTKRMVDFNYYGDVEDVGKDIYELRSAINVRVFTLVMTTFLSLFITLANQFGWPMIDMLEKSNARSFIAAQILLGVISLLSSTAVITKGVRKLLTFKADADSMTALAALSCMIALIPAFMRPELVAEDKIQIYIPIGVSALLMNALGKLLIIRRTARNFRFVSRSFDRHGVVYVTDEERAERLTRGVLGDFPILASTRKTDFLTDFLRYAYSSDMADAYCRKAAPICFISSVLVSLFLTFAAKGDLTSVESSAFGFSIFSMLVCATSCIAIPFVTNIPLEKVSKKTLENKGVMLGYQSVDDFYDANSVLVDADAFFPDGKVKLAGIKVFSNAKIDEALLEAASLTTHAGSIMRQLFKDVVDGKEDMLYPIENYSFEESLGMCGWINNKRVLFGTRELMTSHNIEGVPTKNKESEFASPGQEIMYLSISGNLAAMFIVDLVVDRHVKRWAKKLCKSKICIILKSVDPCITVKRIEQLFGVPEEMIRILPKRLHEDFDEETQKAVRLSASMATTGKFSSLAQLLIGAKTVHFSAIIGLIVQTVSILLGFGLAAVLILSKAYEENYEYLSATALVFYNAAFALLTYIAVSLRRP